MNGLIKVLPEKKSLLVYRPMVIRNMDMDYNNNNDNNK